jgi:hypothetical protein
MGARQQKCGSGLLSKIEARPMAHGASAAAGVFVVPRERAEMTTPSPASFGLAVPGARLVTLGPALAAGAIAFNVFYWRRFQPGLVSGKLSDLGINFLLPVLLVSVTEWGRALAQACWRRPFEELGARGVIALCILSAVYFSLLKLVPGFTAWHFALLRILATPFPLGTAFRNTVDPTDLATLVTTPLAGWYMTRNASRA